MLVIFAGYLKEMDAMLNTNPGLMGRFPYKYQFKDYNAEQLFIIASRLLQHDDYRLSPEAEAQLRESIAKAYAQRDANFSNARWVEQFVGNGIVPAMASRLVQTGSDDYQTIEAIDVRQAYDRFNPKAISLKHGKNNLKCHLHVQKMKKKYSPRYGCGKCQVGVPCEFRSPAKM